MGRCEIKRAQLTIATYLSVLLKKISWALVIFLSLLVTLTLVALFTDDLTES